ncbi:MAG: AAA family ATPase [Chthoniobacteraceae bacterium]|nr:AAA family ATPase [Chthoniobacteraceae bacterium]
MPHIRIQAGFQCGTSYPLQDQKLTIGRAPDCQLRVDIDGPASRYHAEIYPSGAKWCVKDLGSLNGTKVNKERIKDAVLHSGDRIMVGDSIFEFLEKDASAAGPASPEGLTPEHEAIRNVIDQMSLKTKRIEAEIGKAIIGQKEIVRQLLTAIVSNGHVLMIGLPGLAKTLLVRTVADVLDLRFRRIQFTPDLMPSDITGTDILETDETTGRKEYRFIKGPIFTNILLADEINRTPPKTQAALLEAMQEHRVTAAGETYPLDPPFFVLATQNPLEQEGTYPLPEAQLDRFMFSITIDYPSEADEETIAKVTTRPRELDLQKILAGPQILELQEAVRNLPISDHVVKYATRLVRATRPGDPRAPEFISKWVHVGAGPRASQYLILAAKARAVIEGRLLVTADDVRANARPVLRHRMFTNFTADSEGINTDKIVQKLLEAVPEPGEKDY